MFIPPDNMDIIWLMSGPPKPEISLNNVIHQSLHTMKTSLHDFWMKLFL